MDNTEIGSRIKSIRLKRGETAEVFAKHFTPPASKGTISKWENGRYLPNNLRLKKIAELGNVTVDGLLYGSSWEYARRKIDNICTEHGISDSYFYSVYNDYLPSLREALKNKHPKDAVIGLFIHTLSEEGALSYSFINSEEFEEFFFSHIQFDPTVQNKSIRSQVNKYINEIMEIEINQLQNQKYKHLYDPILKEKILQRILKRYDFEGLTDIGIKQYTKELLEDELDYIQLSKGYSDPHSNINAVDFTINLLDVVTSKYLDEYFKKDFLADEELQQAIEETIKPELDYQTYEDIHMALAAAKEQLKELRNNLEQ